MTGMRRMKTSETAKLFLAKDNFLLLTHKNPDGDTKGQLSAADT